MTASIPTQEDVDRIARELAPDVVRIRFKLGYDWSDDPAIYFRIILSDSFGLWESDRLPYFKFRSQSEQEKVREAAWD